MNKEEKKELDRLCECGHRIGNHTYYKRSFCTRVMNCDCKYFKRTKKFRTIKEQQEIDELK